MDVSSVTSSSIMRPSLFAMASVQPVTSLFNISATTDTSSVDIVDIVDISGLGQLLSASSIFETAILEAAATNQVTFSTVVAATQYFVDAFNSFMQSESMQNSLGGSLGNLFIQVLNTQTTASSGNSKSIIASLSEVGVNLQAATSQNGAGLMTIDFKTLQSAFNADQLGTISLLAQSIQSIGQLAAEFTSLLTQSNNITQSSQISPNAAIFNELLTATASIATTRATVARTTAPTAAAATKTVPTQVEAAVTTVTAAGAAAATAATRATATATMAAPAQVEAVVTTVTAADATAARAAIRAAAAATATTAAPTQVEAMVTTVTAAGATAATAAIRAAAAAATTTTAPAQVAAAVTTATAARTAAAATTTTTAPVEVAAVVTTVIAAGATVATAATMAAAAVTAARTTAPATTTALAPATLSATEPVATPELIATPTATVLPTTTTLPTTLVAVAAAPTTVATHQNFINPIIDASNPAVAAAIAAYHVADRIFDSSKHYEVLPTSFPDYSEIRPVAPIQPVRLDLYA